MTTQIGETAHATDGPTGLRRERGWRSAVFMSALRGLWHLPVSHALPCPCKPPSSSPCTCWHHRIYSNTEGPVRRLESSTARGASDGPRSWQLPSEHPSFCVSGIASARRPPLNRTGDGFGR